jgi:hypothetical protein
MSMHSLLQVWVSHVTNINYHNRVEGLFPGQISNPNTPGTGAVPLNVASPITSSFGTCLKQNFSSTERATGYPVACVKLLQSNYALKVKYGLSVLKGQQTRGRITRPAAIPNLNFPKNLRHYDRNSNGAMHPFPQIPKSISHHVLRTYVAFSAKQQHVSLETAPDTNCSAGLQNEDAPTAALLRPWTCQNEQKLFVQPWQ